MYVQRVSFDKENVLMIYFRLQILEVKLVKVLLDFLSVVMRIFISKKKEEKSSLLLERYISQCSVGSEGSLKGIDNLGLDISFSFDVLFSLEVMSRQAFDNCDRLLFMEFTFCQVFTEFYGYQQKFFELVKVIKMQIFSFNFINVLFYFQVA